MFSARPAYGHVYPLVPLALAAREAGHDVVWATGEAFVPKLSKLGFETHQSGMSIGDAEDDARRRLGDDDILAIQIEMFAELLPRATLRDLEPLLPGVDLVVYEQSDYGAAGAALRAGIPHIAHVIGRSLPPAIAREFAGPSRWIWQGAPIDNPMLGDQVVDIWPPSISDIPDTLRRRIPVRPVPWSEPGPLPAFVTEQRTQPLVYLTLGTIAFGAVEALRAAIQGLAELPVDVLVAIGPGDPALLGDIPDSVHVEQFVPQADVLPHVDLLVHHGGSGTTLGGLFHGIPQLLLPQGADQPLNAEAISKHGSGLSLEGDELTADAITDRALTLIENPSYREAAQELSAEIAAMPSPQDVVPALVALTE